MDRSLNETEGKSGTLKKSKLSTKVKNKNKISRRKAKRLLKKWLFQWDDIGRGNRREYRPILPHRTRFRRPKKAVGGHSFFWSSL